MRRPLAALAATTLLTAAGCSGADATGDPSGLDVLLDPSNSSVTDVARSVPGSITWVDGGPDLSPEVAKAVDCAVAGNRLVGRLRAAAPIASNPVVSFRFTSARGERYAARATKRQDPETLRVEYVALLDTRRTPEELVRRFPGGTSREVCSARVSNRP